MKKLGIIFLAVFILGFWKGLVPAEPTLFQDDFNDGDNDGWTTTVGAWDASAGYNQVTGLEWVVGPNAYTFAGDPLWTDYTFDVDITFGTGITEFYTAVRVDPTSWPHPDGGKQYLLSLDADSDRIRLRYTLGGVDNQVTVLEVPYSLLEQTTYHVQMSIVCNSLEASIDGDVLFSYAFSGSDPIYSNGLIGIGYKSDEGLDGAYFDNVLVTGMGGAEPIANAGPDQVVFDDVTLDGSQSYDPDGTIDDYLWEADLNKDGIFEMIGDQAILFLDSEDMEALGLFGKITEIRLTVTDNDGYQGKDIMLLAVAGWPEPTAGFNLTNFIITQNKRRNRTHTAMFGVIELDQYEFNLGNLAEVDSRITIQLFDALEGGRDLVIWEKPKLSVIDGRNILVIRK